MSLRRWFRRLSGRHRHETRQERLWRAEIQTTKLLAAEGLVRQMRQAPPVQRLADAEFKVFSQFGDDGIIQYLVQRMDVFPQTFVEFGVENYLESNTRFLLLHNNWRGLVLDGSADHVGFIQRDEIYWRHELTAVCAFIDRDNIDSLLTRHGFAGDIGLLSIDIDGNDYWVWERLEAVKPVVAVVEYNSVFGCGRAVTVPYDPGFRRGAAHPSHLYFGCSLPALHALATRKGYVFLGCNRHGNNAYFVRRDWADRFPDLPRPSLQEGYVESRFRESRGAAGQLTFLSGSQRQAAIADLPLVDVVTGHSLLVRQAA